MTSQTRAEKGVCVYVVFVFLLTCQACVITCSQQKEDDMMILLLKLKRYACVCLVNKVTALPSLCLSSQ